MPIISHTESRPRHSQLDRPIYSFSMLPWLVTSFELLPDVYRVIVCMSEIYRDECVYVYANIYLYDIVFRKKDSLSLNFMIMGIET